VRSMSRCARCADAVIIQCYTHTAVRALREAHKTTCDIHGGCRRHPPWATAPDNILMSSRCRLEVVTVGVGYMTVTSPGLDETCRFYLRKRRVKLWALNSQVSAVKTPSG
jgi:hypothetical protein